MPTETEFLHTHVQQSINGEDDKDEQKMRRQKKIIHTIIPYIPQYTRNIVFSKQHIFF